MLIEVLNFSYSSWEMPLSANVLLYSLFSTQFLCGLAIGHLAGDFLVVCGILVAGETEERR